MKYLLVLLTSLTLGTTPIMSLSRNQMKKLFNINPIYPSFSLNPGISLESWCGGNAWNWTYKNSKNDFYNINIRNYANSVSDFLKYYSNVTFSFTGVSGSSGFGRNQYYYGPITTSLNSSDSSYNFFNWSKGGAENQASNSASVNLNWNNNILNFSFSANTWAYKGLNSSWTDSTSNLFVNRITFNSKFDINELHNNLQKALTMELSRKMDTKKEL